MMKEIWKPISGYEYDYNVSNLGNVMSTTFRNNHTSKKRNKIRKKQKTGNYEYVCLYKNGVGKNHYIHRLVAEAFIPNPLKKLQVNHIDNNKINNNLNNLEWVTPKENIQHAHNVGAIKKRDYLNPVVAICKKTLEKKHIFKNPVDASLFFTDGKRRSTHITTVLSGGKHRKSAFGCYWRYARQNEVVEI